MILVYGLEFYRDRDIRLFAVLCARDENFGDVLPSTTSPLKVHCFTR